MKKIGENGEWVYLGTAHFFRVPPIISGTGKATDFKFGYWLVDSERPSEQKPIKNFGKRGAWAYPGTAHFFLVPRVISGTGKAANFKFCMHIYGLNRNKSPLKFREQ